MLEEPLLQGFGIGLLGPAKRREIGGVVGIADIGQMTAQKLVRMELRQGHGDDRSYVSPGGDELRIAQNLGQQLCGKVGDRIKRSRGPA